MDEGQDDYGDITEQQREEASSDLYSPAKMQQLLNESRADRRGFTSLWSLSLDFLAGQQDVQVADVNPRGFFPQRVSRTNIKISRNQLAPVYRTFVELMAARYPALSAVPTSASWEGIQQSIATQQAMKALWSLNNMTRKLDEASMALSPCGQTFFHTYFDPRKEKVCIDIVNPFDVIVEKGAPGLREADWYAIRRIYTRAALIEQFPEHEAYIMQAAAMDDQDRDSQRIPGQQTLRHRLPVFYVYRGANHDAPKIGILLRNRWLWQGDGVPMVRYLHMARFMPLTGRLYSVSQIELLIDPQRAYNEFCNFAIDIARMTSNPVWVVPSNAGVAPGDLTNAPGAIIRYNGSANPPVRQPAPAVPPHLFDLQGRALAEIADLAGIHGSSMGKRQTGVVSNVAMEQLVQRDSGQLYLCRAELEVMVVDTMKDALTLWRSYMPDEVAIAMMDERVGSMVNDTVKAIDLLDKPNVLIEQGSMFQAMQRDREERILSLATAGFIDPADAIKQIDMPMREMDALNKAVGLRHAKWLLQQCQQGKFINVLPEDDVESIAQVFKEFINSEQYYDAYNAAQASAEMGFGDPMEVELQRRIAEYIRQVYIAVTTPLDQPPQILQLRQQQNVFPRNQPPAQLAPQQMPGGVPGQQGGPERQQAVQQARQQQDVLRGPPGVTGSL